jgi:uncharacterized damage-inducible protein DinB
MQLADHVRLMAEYNRWMNQKLYAAYARLSPVQLAEDRQAFFGSVLKTLNHLIIADTLWLKRFALAGVPCAALAAVNELTSPTKLDEVLFAGMDGLTARRALLDQTLLALAGEATDEMLQQALSYMNFRGEPQEKIFFNLLMHVFNHQTHHRGQVTTLLSQFGIDVGLTDLVAIVPGA